MKKKYTVVLVLSVEVEYLTEAMLISAHLQRYAHDYWAAEVKTATAFEGDF